MSRPPRPLYRSSTTGLARDDRQRLDFVAPDYAALLELERRLAEEETGLVTTNEEGDFARTLMEGSALLGHLLGLYQEAYAQEAFLGTAQSDASLVRHARRLAYLPDAGLSATGFAALTVGEGLDGRVTAGLALASTPRGEIKAQDYETLEDLDVEAARNTILPAAASRPVRIRFDDSGQATLPVRAIGLGLEAGDIVLLIGPVTAHRFHLEVTSAREYDGMTSLRVRGGPRRFSFELPTYDEADPTTHYRLLARPSARLHPFAWNASSAQFPSSRVRTANLYTAPAEEVASIGDAPAIGYLAPHCLADIYLAEEPDGSLLDGWILFEGGGGRRLLRVTAQSPAKVTLMRGEVIGIEQPLFNSDGTPQRNGDGTVQTTARPQRVETSVSGSTAALRLTTLHNALVDRPSLPFPGVFLAEWQVDVPLVDTQPNPQPIAGPLVVAGDLSGLEPGRLLAFSDLAGEVAQVFQLRSLRVQPVGSPAGSANSELTLQPLTEAPGGHTWTLGDLMVLGNVGRIAHGRGKEEILGSSDGVTPFLEFALKEPPLSQLPGAEGGEPAIEVRVADIAWQRIEDFYDSGPDDRHYRLVLDHDGEAKVLFGDGQKGAIPPSGKRHIRALYKVGLGKDGNVDALGVQRIKKAHPLIERAFNPTALIGGAEPASAEDIRLQATRHILTFDRAVSVQDHADLALLFPGVARSAASWDDGGVIELVAATADGTAPPIPALRAFLDRRRDTEIPLHILPPQPVDLYLTIHLEHDLAYLPETVRRAVQHLLHGKDQEPPGLFTFAGRTFGQAAHRSEVYAAVEGVEGVTFSAVTRFAASPQPVTRDVVLVTTAGWLRLLPENLELVVSGGAS